MNEPDGTCALSIPGMLTEPPISHILLTDPATARDTNALLPTTGCH